MTTIPLAAKRARPPLLEGLGSRLNYLRSPHRGERGVSQLAGHGRLGCREENFVRLAHRLHLRQRGVGLRLHVRRLLLEKILKKRGETIAASAIATYMERGLC
jgi:hypothetical protein